MDILIIIGIVLLVLILSQLKRLNRGVRGLPSKEEERVKNLLNKRMERERKKRGYGLNEKGEWVSTKQSEKLAKKGQESQKTERVWKALPEDEEEAQRIIDVALKDKYTPGMTYGEQQDIIDAYLRNEEKKKKASEKV